MFINFILAIIIFALVFLVAFIFFKWGFKRSFHSLELKTLLIKLPKNEEEESNFLEEINLSEQLFGALASIKEPFVFESAVHHVGGQIYFYLSVPAQSADFAEKQIQGLFPEAQIERAVEYTVFSQNGASEVGYLKLEKNEALPIRTYKESQVDTFAPIISTLSKLQESGDGAAVQVVVKPVTEKKRQHLLEVKRRLRAGESFGRAVRSSSIWREFFDTLFASNKSENKNENIDDDMVEAVQAKLSKNLFSVNVRLVTSSTNDSKAEDIFSSIAGSFQQFSSPLRNGFKVVKPKKYKNEIFNYVYLEFDKKRSFVLNAEEVASIFHLPTRTVDIPRIKWMTTKEAPAPEEMANIDDGIILGHNNYRGDITEVRLGQKDRRRHMYIIGQTGTGKTFFMLDQIVQDMANGHGVCLIDPHGDLVGDVLERVPKNRANDIIVFDPGDTSYPLGLNMLEYNEARPEERTFIVNEMQAILDRLFDKETMGPAFQQYMRNALMLLMEDSKNEPATLTDIPRVFTDEAYREAKLSRITSPAVINFWRNEAAKTTGEHGLANVTPYVTSKFGNFIANDYIRPIIGQTKSAFNFRQVMDDKKILLVNLSKGRIGDINAGLLGMVVVGKILLAALSRGDVPEMQRPDFHLYIDEFQNFTTDSIGVILSEARKYHLNLTLAHQFISQLEDNIRESVFGNTGSYVSFRVGASDAEFLEKYFKPTFDQKDLISVENQHGFAKLLLNGEPTSAFNFKTRHAGSGLPLLKEKLLELSRLTYGRELSEVESEIQRRLS